ncbi:hypothetical protein TIFTF001_001311 [Ficus carica]|uniref:Uncharacterized protein n=1 Tax=Ficus carica TaxID=3494 RepID=A0AA87ZLK4_FICCA|nr:hypothetical protein TIFTF001_001311 [Ficus carica]
MLQTGDIVEELRIGTSITVKSPFKNGRSGVQKILHSSFRAKDTSILVRVRRGRDEFTELQACIVPNDSAGKKQYMLRSIDDPNYAVGFLDRTELDCFDLQDPPPLPLLPPLSQFFGTLRLTPKSLKLSGSRHLTRRNLSVCAMAADVLVAGEASMRTGLCDGEMAVARVEIRHGSAIGAARS